VSTELAKKAPDKIATLKFGQGYSGSQERPEK